MVIGQGALSNTICGMVGRMGPGWVPTRRATLYLWWREWRHTHSMRPLGTMTIKLKAGLPTDAKHHSRAQNMNTNTVYTI